jgi:hypothetical protein
LVKVIAGDGEFKARRLAWRSDRGPFSSSGKVEADEEYYIPVAAKGRIDTVSLRAANGEYVMRWKAVYVTDSAGLINGNDSDGGSVQASYQRDSLPPGVYRLEFEIRKGLKRLDRGKNTFSLIVPQDSMDLDGFRIS